MDGWVVDAAAAAAAVVHEGYLTCIVVSSLVGRPFIKANRRCVCSSSILFECSYLTYLHFFCFYFYFYLPLSFDDDHNSEQ